MSSYDKPKALLKALPAEPRCMACYAPFESYGERLMRLIGRARSSFDGRFCQTCERSMQEHPGGTHVHLAMVFADVRGSTQLAERLDVTEFSQLINRFYISAARAWIDSYGFIDRLAGDEVIGFFVPGMAGEDYPSKAIEGARHLLKATGLGPNGNSWIPVGVGAHIGQALIGLVGSQQGRANFTALGDDVNVGARIASSAGPGELLASLELCQSAGIETGYLERRILQLKGKQAATEVAVIPVD